VNPHALDVTAVLIADLAPHHENLTIENNDLEFMSDRYYNDVMTALNAVCSGVVHYHSPSDFMDNIAKHKDHVVLSVWSGVNSRNRRGLVPSICEAYNIPYVGADTYAQIVCQDKALAKRYAEKFGFSSAQGQLIGDRTGLERIRLLTPPLVVKPNFEGGSIGISQSNLVDNHSAAETLCAKLLGIYQQSVLVEEFISGREVSIVYAGNATDILVMEAMELFFVENPEVLNNIILGYETKKAGGLGPLKKRSITYDFPSEVLAAGRALFTALDKVEVLRIDGRYSDGRFTVIELSPDAHLGKNATVARAFDAAGYSYEEMFERLLANALLSRIG
jgi:D-alanine-D-alanine ligase